MSFVNSPPANDPAIVPDSTQPVLRVRGLKKHFPIRKGMLMRAVAHVHAVDGISFDLARGKTLGIVGESGCGKTTAGKTILRLLNPTSGSIELCGHDITSLNERALRPLRSDMQMIFQDPYASLNPRLTVGSTVAEPFAIHGIASKGEMDDQVAAMFEKVGLRPDQMSGYPHQFSGGQRQRVAIARALAVKPSLIVCDEPVSALDVSIQAQILNLMMDLQDELGMSYLFISHDIAVVDLIADDIAVMYLGSIVEQGTKEEVLGNPRHPYTEALLSAVPIPDPQKKSGNRIALSGDVPDPSKLPSGCIFHQRCPIATARCHTDRPALRIGRGGHSVACHLRDPE